MHGSQWTAKQIKALNDRKQPVVTYNREGRKINAVVGLLAKQRRDPKGFPRTEGHEQGAELATAVLRYVMDDQMWETKDPESGMNAAVDGLGGIEIVIEPGDTNDPRDHEIGFETVDPSSFFYDPRSTKPDFSDARYMGVAKWADIEEAIEMFPDREADIRASVDNGSELTSNPDKDVKWLDNSDGGQRVRLVDHWYIWRGQWRWAIYTGTVLLGEGDAFIRDDKGKSICKYVMFSAFIDQDGDRYGFHRNMKSSQDEINQRRSKALHTLNTRRMKIEDGSGLDVEKVRKEAARPDGVIVYPAGTPPPEFDDGAKAQEIAGHLAFLTDAKQEIENYGFNPALIGTGVQDMSGRAIALQQQAGIAELGPFMLAYRGWKLRVYRAVWYAVQQHWTAQRWVRVTDDEQVAQFFAVNRLGIDPQTGLPAIVNALGSLDVDVILDEGPDTINMQADAYDTLSIMAKQGAAVPPEVLIELSPLQGRVKKKVLEMLQKARQEAMQASQPGPIQQQGIMLEMQGKAAENAKTEAEVELTRAKTLETRAKAGAEAMDARMSAVERLMPQPKQQPGVF